MRYSQLKAFHHVAQLGGFSRAAEALFLTQPAISEQVKKLEQTHDVLLFKREKKQVHLTNEGKQLLLLTNQFFEIEQSIRDHLSESRAAIEGNLRIVADSAHHVTNFLGIFRQRYPSIRVSLRVGNTEDILEQLRSYHAEIGVVGSLTPGQDMDILPLGKSNIVAFAADGFLDPQQKSLCVKDLVSLPLIVREAGSKTRQHLEDAAKAQGLLLTPAIIAEGREAVREIVASGAGVGFVSQAEYGHDDRLIQITLSDINIQMTETIVHLSQRKDVRVIRAFMDTARTFLNA